MREMKSGSLTFGRTEFPLRSPLSRWIADATAIEQLRPTAAAERIRDLHLGRLSAEMIDEEDDPEVLKSALAVLTHDRPAKISFRRPRETDSAEASSPGPALRIGSRLRSLEQGLAAPPAPAGDPAYAGGAVSAPTSAASRWRRPRGWPNARNPFWCPPRRTRRGTGGGDSG